VWVSISAYVLGIGVLLLVVNLVYSLVFERRLAEANPWLARGLEWQVPTPVPAENFPRIPTVLNWPYDYGNPNALPVADFGVPGRPGEPAPVTGVT
jgi:cytochrome c oxidase subunit 1